MIMRVKIGIYHEEVKLLKMKGFDLLNEMILGYEKEPLIVNTYHCYCYLYKQSIT